MAERVRRLWNWSGDSAVPRAYRHGCAYEAYRPDRLADRVLFVPADAVQDLIEGDGLLRDALRPLVNVEALGHVLIRAEAVGSSWIEGLHVTPQDLLLVELAESLGARHERNRTAREVLGNVRALRVATDAVAGRPAVSVDDILAVHRTLMEASARPDLAGRLRTTQNWVGGTPYRPCGAEFVPPPPEDVPDLLADLAVYLNRADHPVLLQAALAHHQFETIHPFGDGNGRVGRALIHVVLRRRGYAMAVLPPVSVVLRAYGERYFAALDRGRYVGPADSAAAVEATADWLRLFAGAVRRAALVGSQLSERLAGIVADWRVRLGRQRSDATVLALLDLLVESPVFTVASIHRQLGERVGLERTAPAVYGAIHQLEVVGIVTSGARRAWGQVYHAPDVIAALGEFEALAQESADQ